MKKRLEAAKRSSGRSFSEEVSTRLETSFTSIEFKEPETKAFAALIGYALDQVEQQTGHPWYEHPWAFKHAQAAIGAVLTYFEPRGELEVPDDAPVLQSLRAQGLSDLAEKAKAQLEESKLGELAGREAVAMAEAVAGNTASPRLDYLKPIADVIKARLIAACSDGDALDDLKTAEGKPGSGVRL